MNRVPYRARALMGAEKRVGAENARVRVRKSCPLAATICVCGKTIIFDATYIQTRLVRRQLCLYVVS